MSIRHLLAAAITACSLAFAALPSWAAVDANQASETDLQSVKGIGPGLSGKIIAARKQGAFKNWTDLVERVSGVGPGNAARFSQAGLTVAGSSYAPSSGVAAASGKAAPAAKPAVQAKPAGR